MYCLQKITENITSPFDARVYVVAYVVPPPVDIAIPVEITETPIPDEVKDNPIDVLPDESDGEDEELDGQVEKSDGQEDEESGDEENKDPAEERNIFDIFFYQNLSDFSCEEHSSVKDLILNRILSLIRKNTEI